jgi:hypothetical protein
MTDLLPRVQRLSEPQRRLLRLRVESLQRDRTGGEAHLVGYVVPRIMGTLTAQALRAFVSERVPDYMVPSRWVFLDALPLTSRGKVDRQALLAEARHAPATARQIIVPRNEHERAIAAIWEEVLGLSAVGLHDNFFELGGHSLLLPKVLTKVRAVATREVSMVDLFRYPTVEALAAYVAAVPTPVTGDHTAKQIKDKREAGLRRLKQRRTQQAVMRTE